MVPPLPLEIELYILDHALPPLTPKRLGDRRVFLKTLSLVRRAWRPYAQKKLFAFPKVDNRVDRLHRWTLGVGMRRIDAVEVEYRVGDGRALLQTMETLRHLFLAHALDGLTQELEKLETPLASLSVVAMSPATAEALEPWCAAHSVELRLLKEKKAGEADIQEWALAL
ncbi:hypothetical protein JCM10213v2_000207 [Rhodosporidiobolus nylandii]